MRIFFQVSSEGASYFQINDVRCEPNRDSMLFASLCYLRGVLIEGAKRKVDRYLVDDVISKKFCEFVKIASQVISAHLEFRPTGVMVHETYHAISELRHCFYPTCELDRAPVGAKDQQKSEVPSFKSDPMKE